MALAQHGFDFVCGVDIVQEAVDISISALKDLEMHSAPSKKGAWQVQSQCRVGLSGALVGDSLQP